MALTRHADLVAADRDAATFTSEWFVNLEEVDERQAEIRRSMLEMDGPRHLALRRLLSREFTPRAVAGYATFLRGLTARTLDAALAEDTFDFVAEIAADFPINVLARMLDVPDGDIRKLIDWGNRIIADTDPDYADVLLHSAESERYRDLPFRSPASLEVFEYGRELAARRRGGAGADLISRLVNQRPTDGEPLSERDFDNYFLLLVVARERDDPARDHARHARADRPSGAGGAAARRSRPDAGRGRGIPRPPAVRLLRSKVGGTPGRGGWAMGEGDGAESRFARVAEMVPPAVVSAFLRAAFGLPGPVRRLIAGSPVRLDGQELALDAQLLLLLVGLESSNLSASTVASARRGLARGQVYLSRVPARPVRTKDVDAGGVPARLYTPRGLPDGSPLLVFYHGGGWVIGDLGTHDTVCRYLAVHAEVRVLSVDYRLAPEHRYPAAADDALTAYAYAAADAGALGADPDAIAVGGDSAGGNLAAVVGALADRRPGFALLLYPATDMTVRRRSRELFGDGFYLTDADMVWFSDHYCPDVGRRAEPKASPLLAEDLSEFPATYLVTAGFDPLRDEGEAFAKRLAEAGVPVALRRQDDLFHGFANTWSLGGRFQEALSEAAGALRTGLYAGPRRRDR